MKASPDAKITTARIERALRTIARVVAAPGGETYVPIFERLESELAARQRTTDARERARAIAASATRQKALQ